MSKIEGLLTLAPSSLRRFVASSLFLSYAARVRGLGLKTRTQFRPAPLAA